MATPALPRAHARSSDGHRFDDGCYIAAEGGELFLCRACKDGGVARIPVYNVVLVDGCVRGGVARAPADLAGGTAGDVTIDQARALLGARAGAADAGGEDDDLGDPALAPAHAGGEDDDIGDPALALAHAGGEDDDLGDPALALADEADAPPPDDEYELDGFVVADEDADDGNTTQLTDVDEANILPPGKRVRRATRTIYDEPDFQVQFSDVMLADVPDDEVAAALGDDTDTPADEDDPVDAGGDDHSDGGGDYEPGVTDSDDDIELDDDASDEDF